MASLSLSVKAGELVLDDEAVADAAADVAADGANGPLNDPGDPVSRSTLATPADESMVVNRPWQLDTMAGPTAFVLERREVQVGLYFQSIMSHLRVGVPVFARYGLSEKLSVGVGSLLELNSSGRGRLLIADGKWNFANTGLWSFGLRSWVGYLVSSNSHGQAIPAVFEIAASRVFSSSAIGHFSLSLGRNRTASSLVSTWFGGGSGNQVPYESGYSNFGNYKVVRTTAVLESRLSQRHGVTFSVSPQLTQQSWGYSYVYNGSDDGSSSDLTTAFGIPVGVSYQYLKQYFCFALGLEMGPTWRDGTYFSQARAGNPAYSSHWTDFDGLGMTSLALGLDVRF